MRCLGTVGRRGRLEAGGLASIDGLILSEVLARVAVEVGCFLVVAVDLGLRAATVAGAGLAGGLADERGVLSSSSSDETEVADVTEVRGSSSD